MHWIFHISIFYIQWINPLWLFLFHHNQKVPQYVQSKKYKIASSIKMSWLILICLSILYTINYFCWHLHAVTLNVAKKAVKSQCQDLLMTCESLVGNVIVSYVQCILCKVQMAVIVLALPSRLATTESRPVPAPISSTALSIRFTCCWLFSKNWHKATACRANFHYYISNNKVSECTIIHHHGGAYPGPDQSTISIYRLANADVMTSKIKRLLSQRVVNTRLPDVPPVQSLSGHHFLVC